MDTHRNIARDNKWNSGYEEVCGGSDQESHG